MADDIFTSIFLEKNRYILIPISLTFVSRGTIDRMPALVQIDNGMSPNMRQSLI